MTSRDVERKVMEMIVEAKNPRNDGWITMEYMDSLRAIQAMIERAFPDA